MEQKLLEKFTKDSKWFYENINKLREKGYTGKFVAIKNSEPFVSNEEIEVVIEELNKKKENISFIFIEFVHPEGFTLLL